MLLTKIQKHISEHFPEMENAKLLLAVSGGVDSMVMLHLFKKLNFNITVAHCNFKLRGEESDKETAFLKRYFTQQNIAHHVIFFDTNEYANTHKLSTQLAARELRYNWFYTLLKQQELDYILTAHHLDDQVETFLINVTRGTGIEGILGIPPKNDRILRPMLSVSREEIVLYAKENDVEWCEDSSNQSTKYFRNKIRHKVVPVLKELNEEFLPTFLKTITHFNQFSKGYNDGFKVLKNKIVAERDNYWAISLQNLMQLEAPETFLYHFLKPYNFTAWDDIYALPYSKTGKVIYSLANYVLLKNRDELLLKKVESNQSQTFVISNSSDFKQLPVNISVNCNEVIKKNNKFEVLLDLDKLNFPLFLRKWKEGDCFYPAGMQGKKNIAKFFKDEKFSQFQKNETWLLVQNNNVDIIWIVGYRADKRFLATTNTSNTIKIQI